MTNRPSSVTVDVKGRSYVVYFHVGTGAPHCVTSTAFLGGVPSSVRRLPITGSTARAAIAKVEGSAS